MDQVAETFEAQRDRLLAIGHRMLGSHADAEDVVQEAWLRLARQDTATIDNLPGWLTTVVGRICLDVLRSRHTHPEAPYDDLVVTVDDGPTPDDQVALADSVGLALAAILRSLQPSERLAFVLHDLFLVPFDEIGRIVGRSTDAAKMLASRARRKVRTPERLTIARQEQRQVIEAFRAAALGGDFEELLRLLDPDVKLTVDTPDGMVVILGATKVATGARMSGGEGVQFRAVLVDGLPGYVSWRPDGTPVSIIAFTVVDGRIVRVTVVTDPAKLRSMDLPDPQ
ncbi:sigma-70 family RNA polymerase sigma factor [Actinocrispum wychmicini]|uniref:RNA polymerase sigma-70 factor (ECF subfamily) n=1 Tax=Actinocrispum wychmicini TaxID=1213861 RepID=A0A4R2IX81_9PSEU|nr:sigma-70 family RNA polymerase sigma factor [Actinocrispum wychmicini]TCO48878.1 RNA polymerase sigma-70 factor (ECF subfamily) [Actinocrispum wychmicini]